MKPLAASTFAIALITALVLGTSAASAGPLLDRIKERRAARAEEHAPAAEQTLEDPYGADKASTVATAARKVLRDVPYGSDPKQRMDVYLPAQAQGSGPTPVIFMVHGGGWRTGDKRMGRVVDNKTARWLPRGFVFVSVNNRLLPEADPLDQVRDVAQALATAQGQAANWGADPQQFILMGHSAGAHLVALLAASPTLASEAGAKPWLGTVALDSAALDVAPIMQRKHYKLYDPAFGTDPAFWKATSPLQQLHAGAKPLLAVCSSRREESCEQARSFAAQATRLGVRAQVLPQDMSHGEINEQLGTPGGYTQSVEAFMASLSAPVASRLH
jgi:arylformamidase